MLVLILGMAIYGWWHGKPNWLFPWLGYLLLPVVVAGLFLLYLPKGWSWLAVLFYLPFALRLLYVITVQTIRRDWLYSSLMLLPVPVIIGWVLAVQSEPTFPKYGLERIQTLAPWIGLTFLALATAVATFIRVRQRGLKIAVLMVSGVLTLIMVAYYADGRLGLLAFLVLMLVMVGLFLAPPLLERMMRYRRHQSTAKLLSG